MSGTADHATSLRAENAELRSRLDEAEETLRAIRSGEVEALVIGDQIYTLESADAASNRFRGEALDQINDAVISIDDHRRLTYMNPAAENLYRVSASDVLGAELSDLFGNRWPDGTSEDAAFKVLKSEGSWRGETVQVRRDGTEFNAEATVSLLRDPSGTETSMLAVIRDVSDRKRAEAEVLRAKDMLEVRVGERTHQLAETNAALRSEMTERAEVERQRTDLLQRIVSSQEDERRRIARDIHDKLGQRVTALRLQIESLSLNGGPPLEGGVEILKRTAVRLDSEVSFLAWELRPAALDDLGLPEAAKAYLEDWSHNYKISSGFSLRGFAEDPRLRPDEETHLYRIMQEALNNIAKHAKATNVSVLLEKKPSGIEMIIEDNGQGFDLSTTAKRDRDSGKGLGLLGMRERALLIGGVLEFESSPGVGTTIYIRIPTHATH